MRDKRKVRYADEAGDKLEHEIPREKSGMRIRDARKGCPEETRRVEVAAEEPRPHPQAQHRCQDIGWGGPSVGEFVGIKSKPVSAGVVSLPTPFASELGSAGVADLRELFPVIAGMGKQVPGQPGNNRGIDKSHSFQPLTDFSANSPGCFINWSY